MDTDAELSMADVAHVVTLSYSPYADTTLADGSVDGDEINPNTLGQRYEIGLGYDKHSPSDPNEVHGFTIVMPYHTPESAIAKGMKAHAGLFRIIGGFSGNDTAGVVGCCNPYGAGTMGPLGVNFIDRNSFANGDTSGSKVMTLEGPWLSDVSASDYHLKILLDLLLDARYNPYEEAGERNEKDNFENLKKWINFGYIRCSLEYVGDDGNILAHYENRNVVASVSNYDGGNWFGGPDPGYGMWLAYYDPSDRKKSSGFGGWKKNRQCIGRWTDDLPAIYTKRGEGEYIPLSPLAYYGKAGALRLTIYNCIFWLDDDGKGEGDKHKLAEIVRWCLLGQTTMEIVRADGSAIDTDDIIYTATAIEGAASDKEVGLEAGSVVKTPTARAVISIGDGASLRPVGPGSFVRTRAAGVEELLLDTLVSQYDEPHVILSGHADLSPVLLDDFCAWSERSQPEGCRFIPTSVTVYAGDGTAEYAFREISPDQYSPST